MPRCPPPVPSRSPPGALGGRRLPDRDRQAAPRLLYRHPCHCCPTAPPTHLSPLPMHMCTQVCVDKYHFCLVSARGPVGQGTASLAQRTAPWRRCQLPPLARTADTCMPWQACRTVTAVYTGLTSGFRCLPLPSLSSGQHGDAVRGRHALQDPGGEVHLPVHALHLACACSAPSLHTPASCQEGSGMPARAEPRAVPLAQHSAVSTTLPVHRSCHALRAPNWMHPPANISHPLATLPSHAARV